MTLTTSILQQGTHNHLTTSEEANKFATNFITPGVVGTITNTSGVAPMTGAFAVNAAGTPNKTVLISVGDAYIQATPSGQGSQVLNVTNNSVITQTINDNVTGSTRYDWIYLKVDPTNANDPDQYATNVATVLVNRSTSNVSDTVGAPAYYQLLAVVTLANGFTSIPNSNIQDRRTVASAAMPDGSVTAVKLASGSVTPSKLDLDPDTSIVTTSETTTSTSYVGLTTAQAISVTVGTNGLLLVSVAAGMAGTGGNLAYTSFALSGANTLASADAKGVSSNSTTTDGTQYGRTELLKSLNPGVTTVTQQFRVGGGTGTFKNRSITAIPL